MPTTVDYSATFVWEGPLGPRLALFCALILLSVFTWALWRERQILGNRLTALFWILRAIALGVAGSIVGGVLYSLVSGGRYSPAGIRLTSSGMS